MRGAAARWACAVLAAAALCAPGVLAQPADTAPRVTSPVDWAAVRSQLAARTDSRLRQVTTPLSQLVPEGFGSARTGNLRPKIPVLIPLFAQSANGNGAGGRALAPSERNFLPVTQSGADSAGRALAPRAPSPVQPETMIFPETNTYAATIKLPQGATVTVSGSNVARPIEAGDGAARVLGGRTGESVGRYQMSDVVTEQTETGFAISFTRFGVAYNVEIECVILKDVRCTDPDFVRELSFSMGLLGDPPS
jgi:hypothetical protein